MKMGNGNYKVLFFEDDEDHYQMVKDYLSLARKGQFDLEWVSRYETLLDVLSHKQHDVYLVDHGRSEPSGLTVLQAAKERHRNTPVIMLTGYDNEQYIQQSLEAGATDYLIKGHITPDLLERSLIYAIENQRVNLALSTSKKFARNIIDCSLDMIIAVDQNRRLIEFNPAAQKTFDYRPEEVIGRHVDFLYADPSDGLQISEELNQEHGTIRKVRNIRRNGEIFPSMVAASMLRDAEGRIIGAMGISRDITAQIQAEERLKQWNEQLERRVAERIAQLGETNRALQVEVAERAQIEQEHASLIRELQEALANVKTLKGLIPICAHCKKIRDDQGYWNQLEEYIRQRSEAEFTHGICPDCFTQYYPELQKD